MPTSACLLSIIAESSSWRSDQEGRRGEVNRQPAQVVDAGFPADTDLARRGTVS